MTTFVLATSNKGKLKEISEILSFLNIRIMTMDEVGCKGEIPEDGDTFEENALIKAGKVFDVTGRIVIADDSGLAVDCLNGRPGVHSARYTENGTADEDRIDKLLSEMAGVPLEKRTARFITAVAVVWKSGSFIVKETCEGRIGFNKKGANGFGYDPVFYADGHDMTMAELTSEEKNRISARGKAFRMMLEKIREIGPENMA